MSESIDCYDERTRITVFPASIIAQILRGGVHRSSGGDVPPEPRVPAGAPIHDPAQPNTMITEAHT